MRLLKNLLRSWHAKGHGIHSPFAYRLITNVLHSPHAYNAFFDIENLLAKNNISPEEVGTYHHLLFRLTYYLKPRKILEIGSRKGVATLFLSAAHPQAEITCIENNETDVETAKKLLEKYPATVAFKTSIEINENTPYDAIIIHSQPEHIPDTERLFALSHENTFCVFHPWRKPLRKNFVKDKRARVVFDMKHAGVVFLNPSYNKAVYYV